MKNAVMKVEGTILTITVDLSRTQGPSKSGKSQIIATSEGNVLLAPEVGQNSPAVHGVYVGLNLYAKK